VPALPVRWISSWSG